MSMYPSPQSHLNNLGTDFIRSRTKFLKSPKCILSMNHADVSTAPGRNHLLKQMVSLEGVQEGQFILAFYGFNETEHCLLTNMKWFPFSLPSYVYWFNSCTTNYLVLKKKKKAKIQNLVGSCSKHDTHICGNLNVMSVKVFLI